MTFSVAGIIRTQARLGPDRPAIVFGDRVITYGELDARANRVARALQRAGIGAGDRIAFIDRNSPEYFEVLFGGAKLNAVNVCVNWRLQPGEMASLVNDSEARVLFAGPEFHDHLDRMRPHLRTVSEFVSLTGHPGCDSYAQWLGAGVATDPGVEPKPGDVALQLYTSGTTGLPKGVMLTNANLECTVTRIAPEWEFDHDSVNLVASPLFNIAGGGWALVGMNLGCRTVLIRDVTPPALLEIIPRQRVTNALFVPVLLQFMLNTPGCDQVDFSSLRAIVYGASPISEEVLAGALRVFGCHFIQAYALTEHTGAATILRPEEHDLARPGRLRSAGRPLSWVQLRIVDPVTHEEVAPGATGEVELRSPQVMLGYWNRPDDTALGAGGWLRTGDAGRLDEDGFLYLLDRVKDMIISGGQNIYPAEVENVLIGHPGVADVAVIGVPDDRWGETPKAICVRAPGTSADAVEVIEFCRERIAHYKCPTSVEWVDQLPRNPSGKVLKRELREPYWAGRERRVN